MQKHLCGFADMAHDERVRNVRQAQCTQGFVRGMTAMKMRLQQRSIQIEDNRSAHNGIVSFGDSFCGHYGTPGNRSQAMGSRSHTIYQSSCATRKKAGKQNCIFRNFLTFFFCPAGI